MLLADLHAILDWSRFRIMWIGSLCFELPSSMTQFNTRLPVVCVFDMHILACYRGNESPLPAKRLHETHHLWNSRIVGVKYLQKKSLSEPARLVVKEFLRTYLTTKLTTTSSPLNCWILLGKLKRRNTWVLKPNSHELGTFFIFYISSAKTPSFAHSSMRPSVPIYLVNVYNMYETTAG